MITYGEMKSLVIGKLVDKTVDESYEELSERLFGEGNAFNGSEVRKRMYGMKRVIDILENDSDADTGDTSLDERLLRLKQEQQRFYDQRAAYTKLVRDRTRQEELNDIVVRAIQSGELPTLSYERQAVPASDNDLLVSLNDIHYGANINNAWNVYNPTVCVRMMEYYADHIVEIAKTHGSENCIVYNCGDSIHGRIHTTVQLASRENAVEQVIGVSEAIANFIAALSKYFNTVTYVSVPGNHSRLDSKDNSPLTERLDDIVEWYLAARLQNFENVNVGAGYKLDNTLFTVDVRGKTYCGVHGDFDSSPTKIAALQTMIRTPLYAVLSGHMHHNKIDSVQGIKTVMAGSFLGVDDYCISKRIFGEPEQLVCVCDHNGIRCHYDIRLRS